MVDPREEEMTRLGLMGLIPFALGVLAVWLPSFLVPGGLAYDFGEATILYAGVVASYLAGIGAGGLLMSGPRANEGLAPGMIAVLTAWLAILPVGAFGIAMHDLARCLLLIGVYLYLLLRDLRAVRDGTLPFWYGALRQRLTFWASMALALIGCRFLL